MQAMKKIKMPQKPKKKDAEPSHMFRTTYNGMSEKKLGIILGLSTVGILLLVMAIVALYFKIKGGLG